MKKILIIVLFSIFFIINIFPNAIFSETNYTKLNILSLHQPGSDGALVDTDKTKLKIVSDNEDKPILEFNFNDLADQKIYILIEGNNKPSKIKINDISGIFKEMVISGSNTFNIVNIEKGIIEKINYPSTYEYFGISNNGQTIYFDFSQFRFSLDVSSKKIIKINTVDFIPDDIFEDKRYRPTDEFRYVGESDQGESYYIRSDKSTNNQCNIYKKDEISGNFLKISSFSTKAGYCPNYHFILDNKLFVSGLGGDYYEPFKVIDIRTGKIMDSGYGGGIVPIDKDKLYYCVPCCWETTKDFHFIIDSKTLKRDAINKLPCPRNTGRLIQHPLPGHFIIIFWLLC